MRQIRLKKKSIFDAQIVLKVFPGVFSSQKKPEKYLQRVHTTKSELSKAFGNLKQSPTILTPTMGEMTFS